MSFFAPVINILQHPKFQHVFTKFFDPVQLGMQKIGSFYYAACLQGEAAEAFQAIQHALRSGARIDREKVGSELADVLWYTWALADQLDINLDEALAAKCKVIQMRVEQGYYKGETNAA